MITFIKGTINTMSELCHMRSICFGVQRTGLISSMRQVQIVTSVKDSVAFHYLSRPRRAWGALLSLSSSTEASLHTFCETSHPQRLWLQELFITEERDRVARELATCLTHFSVGVIAFPVSLLFLFVKMPKLSQLNPG